MKLCKRCAEEGAGASGYCEECVRREDIEMQIYLKEKRQKEWKAKNLTKG